MNEDILYIEQFLGGEQKGYEFLVRKYQNRVLNIVYSLIGRDRDSEDISQEVFLKVYHNLKSFRQRSRFSTWLYRIVVNTVYDFLRRRRNLLRGNSAFEEISAERAGADDESLIKERESMIQTSLGKIPFRYRTAVVLKDIEGLSYIEISKVLRCSIGTVESRIFRARQLLRIELLKFGKE